MVRHSRALRRCGGLVCIMVTAFIGATCAVSCSVVIGLQDKPLLNAHAANADGAAEGSAGAGSMDVDPTFGSGGIVTLTLDAGTTAGPIALYPPDKILIAGRTDDAKYWLATRINSDGSVDDG